MISVKYRICQQIRLDFSLKISFNLLKFLKLAMSPKVINGLVNTTKLKLSLIENIARFQTKRKNAVKQSNDPSEE